MVLFAYADAIVFLAPSPSGLCMMLLPLLGMMLRKIIMRILLDVFHLIVFHLIGPALLVITL